MQTDSQIEERPQKSHKGEFCNSTISRDSKKHDPGEEGETLDSEKNSLVVG
jgi:hypothetical protein